jgi:F-type H+-transporting ATPase subunit b
MLIDWFTVGAQVVNFLILMVLLKIFLYDRVIRAMDEREQKIASRFEEADQKQKNAEKDREKFLEEKKAFDEKRERLLDEARDAAHSKKEALEKEARTDVDDRRERWIEALEKEKEALAREVQECAARQVFTIVRRVLADMADEALQDRIVQVFSTRIHEMDGKEKEQLTESLKEKEPSAVLLSDVAISTSNRQKITRLLRKEIHADLDVDYRTAKDFVGGLELRMPGKKIAWNLNDYLESLEEEVLQTLEAASREQDAAAAKDEDEIKEEESG